MDAVDDIGIYNPSITVCFLAIIFTFGLAFSKYGKIKLEKESLNTPRCHGFYVHLVGYWVFYIVLGLLDWAYYYQTPCLSLPPESAEALKYSVAYSFFTLA